MPFRSRALLACALALVALAATVATATAATPLYPDLKTLAPRDLKLDRADISDDGSGNFHNVLRFSNTVWNDGEGKLVMRGAINPSTKEGGAVQRVYDDAGGFQDYPVGRFYWHPEHSHFHYDNWGRYQLFTKAEYDTWVASGRPAALPNGVEIGTKTTSCVMDEEFIKPVLTAPWPAVFPSSGCMPDSNNNLLEGISTGWGDTYDYYRFEQWIDLGQGQLGTGNFVLRSVTDEVNQVYESPNKATTARESQTANENITNFRVENNVLIDSNPPSGTVTINDVDTQTNASQVTVKVLGRDDILGPGNAMNVDTVRLSNNGSTWKSFGYTGEGSSAQWINWDLADPAFGGNSNAGTKTVYAQFRDRAGKWSESVTDTITLKAPTGSTPYSQAILADNPAAYWRLGDTSGTVARDERGGSNGTYSGSPALNATSLLAAETANKAVTFDGTNDTVNAGSGSALNLTNQVTVEAWIKPTAIPASGQFASVVSKPEAYSLQFNGNRLEFTLMQNGTRLRAQAPAGAIAAGQTYHVVGTYDGANQRLYVNGTQVATRAQTGNATTSSNPLSIGSWGGGEYFRGTIDEVAVYRAALSAAQVQAHKNAGGTTAPPPTSVTAPSGLAATAASPYAIDVRWTDNATNEDTYVLERSTSSTFSSPRTFNLAANTRSFTDSGLTANTTYWYRVKAMAGTTSSAWATAVSAATPTPPATNSYSQVILGDGPTSYWRLGETSGTTASDQKTVNPGTYNGSSTRGVASLLTSDTQNRATGFNGNDYVRVPTSPSLNLTSAITIEAWIKPDVVPTVGFASIVTKPESYSLQFNNGRLELTVIQNGARRRLQAPSGAIVAGRAYHVVGTYDGANQRLYVNGAQVTSGALTGPATIYGLDLFVGSWDGAQEFFDGTIDEASVYARVLSAAQVKAHYDSGIAVPPAGQSLAAEEPAPAATTSSAPMPEPAPTATWATPVAPVASNAGTPEIVQPARPTTKKPKYKWVRKCKKVKKTVRGKKRTVKSCKRVKVRVK